MSFWEELDASFELLILTLVFIFFFFVLLSFWYQLFILVSFRRYCISYYFLFLASDCYFLLLHSITKLQICLIFKNLRIKVLTCWWENQLINSQKKIIFFNQEWSLPSMFKLSLRVNTRRLALYLVSIILISYVLLLDANCLFRGSIRKFSLTIIM